MRHAIVVITVEGLERQVEDILRRVEENGETFAIMQNGEIIARLVPVGADEMPEVLAGLAQLSAEISAQWSEGVSALAAVNDVRRDL